MKSLDAVHAVFVNLVLDFWYASLGICLEKNSTADEEDHNDISLLTFFVLSHNQHRIT